VTKTTRIENAIVTNRSFERDSAQRQGAQPTPVVGSLRVIGGTASAEATIASTVRGRLVSRLWNVRPIDPRAIRYTDPRAAARRAWRTGRAPAP
jgi:hypothetical protein